MEKGLITQKKHTYITLLGNFLCNDYVITDLSIFYEESNAPSSMKTAKN